MDPHERNVEIVQDGDEKKLVLIKDIRFKGKRRINWEDVKEYLKAYVGEFFSVAETDDIIYIGSDFPNEYAGSNYTYSLKGAMAKAKANAAQGIPELTEIASDVHFRENTDKKHARNAKFGWYRYDSRFALPIFENEEKTKKYHVYHASMLVRHAEDGKKYLYDILKIKKETSNPLEP